MIILLSGPIAAGKSTVARHLAYGLGCPTVSVRHALHETLGVADLDRADLQRLGADLDRRTRGRWLVDYLEQVDAPSLVVDSLRTRRQTIPVLDHFVDARLVFITAHEETRRHRYRSAAKRDPIKRSVAYDAAMAHPTENDVSRLSALAHLRLETDELTSLQTAGVILSHLRD